MMVFNGWAVALNGIVLGSDCDHGTQQALDADCPALDAVVVECALDVPPDGLGIPGLRTEDTTYAQRDGVEHFADWYQPRIITLPSVSVCPETCPACSGGDASVRSVVKRIMSAWDRQCGDTELVVYTDCHDSDAPLEDRVVNGPFGMIGRPRVAALSWDRGVKCATMTLRFDAVDHRMYVLDGCGTPGSGETCVTLSPNTSAFARCYTEGVGSDADCYTDGPDSDSRCYDTLIGTDTPPSNVTVFGDVCPDVTITLTGQLTAPIFVENLTTGEQLRYTGSIGAADDPVVIDVSDLTARQGAEDRTFLLNGSFSLPVGVNSLQLRSSSVGDTGTADVCFRHTVVSG